MTTFQQNITLLRKARGFTQQQVADELKMGRSAYQAWEEGRSHPRAYQIPPLARLYNVSIDYLLTGKGFSPKDLHPLLKSYTKAPKNVKKAVDILLNL